MKNFKSYAGPIQYCNTNLNSLVYILIRTWTVSLYLSYLHVLVKTE